MILSFKIPAFLLSYVLFSCFNPVYVKGKSLTSLESILLKYQKKTPLKIVTERKVELKFFQQVKTYKGTLLLGKNQFRWETHHPQKFIWIFTGTLLWDIQFETLKSKKPIQVVKKEIKKNKEGHLLISILKGDLQKTFEVSLNKKGKDISVYSLNLKKRESDSLMKNIQIHIHPKKEKLVLLSYEDDLGNKTYISFKKTHFNVKVKKGTFSYKPPKSIPILSI